MHEAARAALAAAAHVEPKRGDAARGKALGKLDEAGQLVAKAAEAMDEDRERPAPAPRLRRPKRAMDPVAPLRRRTTSASSAGILSGRATSGIRGSDDGRDLVAVGIRRFLFADDPARIAELRPRETSARRNVADALAERLPIVCPVGVLQMHVDDARAEACASVSSRSCPPRTMWPVSGFQFDDLGVGQLP